MRRAARKPGSALPADHHRTDRGLARAHRRHGPVRDPRRESGPRRRRSGPLRGERTLGRREARRGAHLGADVRALRIPRRCRARSRADRRRRRVDRIRVQHRGASSRARPRRASLMDQLVALLGYEFVQNAIAAGTVIAIVSGVVSRFVVARNMSFAVHALGELGFTGAAGFILLRLSPVLGLLAGTAVTAVFIGALGVRARGRDVVVGVVMAFGLGLGVLFITLYNGYANQAFAILFGTITRVSRGGVILLVAIGAVTMLALAAVYRPLTFATVDPEVAEARGVPVGTLAVAFLLIMAAALPEAIQVVAVLLILSLLTTPRAAAERLTPPPGAAILWSVAIALFCILGGILLSLITNAPVRGFVTSLSFGCYLLARFLVGPRRRDLRATSRPAESSSGTAVVEAH